jgi:hypothetical protein
VGITSPVGLAESGDLIHVLDHATTAVYPLKVCFGQLPSPMDLPEGATDPSGLCFHDGHWFVSDATSGAIYELDGAGALIETHAVESFAPMNLRGLAFMGENLFAATDDDKILIYEFGEINPGGAADVPEGTDIIVVPLPDELEIEFPAVADSGSLFVDVRPDDPCPAPEGVLFLPDFYDIATTASFEYIARVAIITDEPLPPDVDPDRVRIFKRPSTEECMPFMDVTTAPIELFPPGETLMGRLTRTLSEEDEFSIFVLAEDFRNPLDIVDLKLAYLEAAIDAVGGFPVDPIDQMRQLLASARRNIVLKRYFRAATLIDAIAEVALATPEIPHLYLPNEPGSNLGGRIVARAHTLSFSIRMLGLSGQHEDPGGAMKSKRLPTTVLEDAAPSGISLLGSNPSRSGFTISLAGTGRHPVSVRIYSVKGELVETLLNDVTLSGPRTLTWDGRDSAGRVVGNGVYFMIVKAGEESTTRKLILQR